MFKEDAQAQEFLKTKSSLWKNTSKISEHLGKSSEYAALFYPGGHGPMFDLANDKDSIALINEFVDAGKPVSAVCHGPAVFVNVVRPDGTHILAGKTVTGEFQPRLSILYSSTYCVTLCESNKSLG